MTTLFGRSWRVAVAQRGASPTALSWTDLRVQASIKKTRRRRPNSATITITNLAASSRAIMEQDDMVVFLYAGLGDGDPPLIFAGDIATVAHERGRTEWETAVDAGDGEHAYNSAYVSMSLRDGAMLEQAIDLATGALREAGVEVDPAAVRDLPIVQLVDGFSFEGRARDALAELAPRAGREWSIQNGAVRFMPIGASDPSVAVVLNPSTGLVGTPKRKFETKGGRRRQSGWEVTSLLQPGIEPGRMLKVESEVLDAFVDIGDVTVDLDTHGAQWFATAQVTERG